MKRQWGEDELAEQWTLAPDEMALLANKAGPTRLGFAVLLKVFGADGRFPRSRQEVPGAVVAHIAKQVGVPAEQYFQYDWRGSAIKYHRAQIRAFLGFREANVENGEALVTWLQELQVPHEQRLEQLREERAARGLYVRAGDRLVHGAGVRPAKRPAVLPGHARPATGERARRGPDATALAGCAALGRPESAPPAGHPPESRR